MCPVAYKCTLINPYFYCRMEVEITPASEAEYPELAEVWEASVRATHRFLESGDIEFYRGRLNGYLSVVRLTAARDPAGRITAFLGTCDGNIEMLFVHPEYMGRGMGRRLVDYAVGELGCNRVDVNEQNGQAVGFYERMGFMRTGRSESDAEGRPYPILHLGLRRIVCDDAE